MIKGITLAICISVFIVSSIFLLSGTTGNLQENILTGATIGSPQLTSYALVAMLISLITGTLILINLRKKQFPYMD